MNKKKIIAILVMCLTAVLLCSCGRSNKVEKKENNDNLPKLVIGSDNLRNYNYINENNEFEGINIDLAKELCSRIGYEPVFKQIEWKNKDDMLNTGNIDCLWGCYFTDIRKNGSIWEGPYMVSRQIIVVKNNSDIYKISDLEGKRISVQAGSQPEEALLNMPERDLPKAKNVFCLGDMEEVFSSLRKNYVDACIGHEDALKEYISGANEKYRILDESFLKSDIGVAFSKKADKKLVSKAGAALKEMKKDGTIDRILNKYRK